MVYGKLGSDREERINYDRMRKYRVERVREKMNEYGWGTLISFDDTHVRYLTGAGLPMQDAGCVILPRNGEPYLYMTGTPLASLRNKMPWLGDRLRLGIRPRPCDCVTIEDCESLVREVTNILDEHGLKSEPLGIEGTTAGALLQDAFCGVGINAVHDIRVMGEAKKIKNQDELECMRMATAIGEASFVAMMDKIRPGVTTPEVLSAGLQARFRLGDDGGPGMPFAAGEGTNPHLSGRLERPLREGDLVYMDCHGCFHGYRMCYFHTFCCGRANTEQKEIYAEARAILFDGLSVVKAGATALEVAEKWKSGASRQLSAENWEQVARMLCFHGIGLGMGVADYAQRFHPGTPDHELEKWKFEENMTLAAEIWNGRPGGKNGICIEEDIIVTKDGYERLAKFPIELTECGV